MTKVSMAIVVILLTCLPSFSVDLDSLMLSRNSSTNFVNIHVLDTQLVNMADSSGQKLYVLKSFSAMSAFLLNELQCKIVVVGLITTNLTGTNFREALKNLRTYWFWDYIKATDAKEVALNSVDKYSIYCCFNLLRTLKYGSREGLVPREVLSDLSNALDCSTGNAEYATRIVLSKPTIQYAYAMIPKDRPIKTVVEALEKLMDKYKLDLSYKVPDFVPVNCIADF